MLINSQKAMERLSSPDNLFNRLRQGRGMKNGMDLFIKRDVKPSSEAPKIAVPNFSKPEVKIPEVLPAENSTPTIDQLIKSADNDIKLEGIHDRAIDVLDATMQEVKRRLPEVSKVKDLADIASKMNKVVTDIRASKREDGSKQQDVHLHFYTPERRKLTDYEEAGAA